MIENNYKIVVVCSQDPGQVEYGTRVIERIGEAINVPVIFPVECQLTIVYDCQSDARQIRKTCIAAETWDGPIPYCYPGMYYILKFKIKATFIFQLTYPS